LNGERLTGRVVDEGGGGRRRESFSLRQLSATVAATPRLRDVIDIAGAPSRCPGTGEFICVGQFLRFLLKRFYHFLDLLRIGVF
jgi:hypothetical protein